MRNILTIETNRDIVFTKFFWCFLQFIRRNIRVCCFNCNIFKTFSEIKCLFVYYIYSGTAINKGYNIVTSKINGSYITTLHNKKRDQARQTS